jgi:hypothetical protein
MAPVQASGPETDTSVADPHAVDVVMAWSVDRLRRSLIDLISGLQEHAAMLKIGRNLKVGTTVVQRIAREATV